MGLLLFPALIKDWYGLVSAFGLVLTITVRAYVLWELRKSIDDQVTKATGPTKTKKIKVLIKLRNGSKVVMDTTTGIVQECLLTEARPRKYKHQRIVLLLKFFGVTTEEVSYHLLARAVCWIGFVFHAVFLGMACLGVQLALVGVTLVCSVLAVRQVWCDESKVGSRLSIRKRSPPMETQDKWCSWT
jgi:hypothetical protein